MHCPTNWNFLRRSVMAALLAGWMLTTSLPLPAADVKTVKLEPGVKQLFLDDYVVDTLSGVWRTMHQVRKHPGNPILRPQYPWDDVDAGGSAPVWNEETRRWEMRYASRGLVPGTPPHEISMCLAVSQDGLHWEKPMLDLHEFHQAKQTNIISRGGKSKETIIMAVYEPDEVDPEQRWKALIGYRNIRPAFSPDGIHWNYASDKPLKEITLSHIIYSKRDRKYLALMRLSKDMGFGRRRSVGLSTSEDFLHWTPPELIFYADKQDQELGRQWLARHLADPTKRKPAVYTPKNFGAEVYGMTIFTYEGLYIGLPMMFYQCGQAPDVPAGDGFSDIQLAASRNLRDWQRLGDRAPFLPLSSIGKQDVYDSSIGKQDVYDLAQIWLSPPVCRDGELWFYYTGIKRRYSTDAAEQPRDVAACCLAKLRLDGFVSLDSGQSEGTLLTKPLVWHGKTMWVNTDASGGQVRVELLDVDGRLLVDRFSKEQAIPIDNDGVRLPVRWETGADLSPMEGKTVRLRFHLRNARLYAFWTEGA